MSAAKSEGADDRFDAAATVRFALRQRWIALVCVIGGLLAGALVHAFTTPLYTATARLEVSQEAPRALGTQSDGSHTSGIRRIETARQYIASRPTAQIVVDDLGLADRAGFLSPGKAGADSEARIEAAVERVRKGLSTALVRNTGILKVRFTHPDPAVARDIANATVDAYIRSVLATSRGTALKAKTFLDERLVEAKAKLESAEAEMVAYAQKHNITTLGDTTSLLEQSLGEMNRLLAVNVLERMTAERDVEQLEVGGAASLPQAFASETTEAAKRRINDLEGEYQEKRQFMKDGFPEMRRLRAQINGLRASLDRETVSIGKAVRLKADHARRKEAVIRAEIDKLERQSRDYENKSIAYGLLKKEIEFDRKHYQGIVERQRAAGVAVVTADPGAAVIESARKPAASDGPGLATHLAGGLAIFGLLGGGIVLVRETLDDTFERAGDLASTTGLRLLGSAPHIRAARMNGESLDTGSRLRQAYRTLRSTLAPLLHSGTVRHVLITGASGGEGVSLTAERLAHDTARPGFRVLLVDANLRQRDANRSSAAPAGPGLADLLRDTKMGGRVGACFRRTDNADLTVLPAGDTLSDSDDWLSARRMKAILDILSKGYDLIVIDGPPVEGMGDAPVLSSLADATLLVTAAGRSRGTSILEAAERLREAGGTIIGTFVTNVRPQPFEKRGKAKTTAGAFDRRRRPRGPAVAANRAPPVPNDMRRDPVGNRIAFLARDVRQWWSSAA